MAGRLKIKTSVVATVILLLGFLYFTISVYVSSETINDEFGIEYLGDNVSDDELLEMMKQELQELRERYPDAIIVSTLDDEVQHRFTRDDLKQRFRLDLDSFHLPVDVTGYIRSSEESLMSNTIGVFKRQVELQFQFVLMDTFDFVDYADMWLDFDALGFYDPERFGTPVIEKGEFFVNLVIYPTRDITDRDIEALEDFIINNLTEAKRERISISVR